MTWTTKLLRSCATLASLVPAVALLAAAPPALAGIALAGIALGSAGSFAVLAGSEVTNSGNTIINGNLGVWPSGSISGFGSAPGMAGPGIVNGNQYAGGTTSGMSGQAQSDLTVAYTQAAAMACGRTLTGSDLGGMTLTPGVYCFSTSAQLTGTLTLNELGQTNPDFIFQIGSTLTTAPGAAVVTVNGGAEQNIYWQVGSSATLDTDTQFLGTIMALASISLNTGAKIECGAALARNAAVTLLNNVITGSDATGCASTSVGNTHDTSVPEPASLLVFAGGVLGLRLATRRQTRCQTRCQTRRARA